MKKTNIFNSSSFSSVTLRRINKKPVEDAEPGLYAGVVDDDALSDKRVKLTKIFIILIFSISVIGLFTADGGLSESFTLSILFFLLAANNYVGFIFLKRDIAVSLIFSLFCVYVWLAFPLKLVLALNDPLTLWVSHSFFSPDDVRAEIAGSFITLFPGLFFLFIGFYSLGFNIKRKQQFHIVKINHMTFMSVIVALMVLRVFNQLVLDIGIPGVKPQAISIPFAVGVLELLTRPVLFALVNLYFFYVVRMNDNKAMMVALVFLLINIVLGLRVGYKSELVLQGLLLIYYLFEVFKYMSKANRKFLSIFTLSMLVIMIVVYPLVNNYRSYLLSGKDFSEAVESAKVRTDKENSSFALSFLNRINGIGAFYAASKLGEDEDFTIDALFNDEVMDLIKERLYGAEKDKAVTAFGTTQFSVFYLVGGGVFLAVCSLIIGWFIRWSSSVLRLKIFKSKYTFQAYLPLLCILWVKLLSSGGNLMLYLKELILVVICLVILERYGTVISTDNSNK